MKTAGLLVLACACGATNDTPKDTRNEGANTQPTSGAAMAPAAVPTAPPKDLPPLPAPPTDATGQSGVLEWVRTISGTDNDQARRLVALPTGELVLAGHFGGRLAAGNGIVAKGGSDAMVVKWHPDGKIAWATSWGAGRDDTAAGIAANSDTIVVVGNYLDALNLDGAPAKSNGSDDAFVVGLGHDGKPKWVHSFGGPDSDGANAVAEVPGAGWVVVGSFGPGTAFGGAPLGTKGGMDAFLLRLGTRGDVMWAKTFGGPDRDTFMHVAVDGAGAIYVLGRSIETSSFGGAPMEAKGRSDFDIVLAKYDANGEHLWSQRFGEAFHDIAGGLAVDAAGHAVIVGSFDFEITIGSHKLVSKGESDAFAARFLPTGEVAWAKSWGGPREDVAAGVSVDAFGNIAVSGWFWGPTVAGERAWPGKGNADGFVQAFTPAGDWRWFHTFGDRDFDFATAIATTASGQTVVAGEFRVQLGLGATPVQSTPSLESKLPMGDIVLFSVGNNPGVPAAGSTAPDAPNAPIAPSRAKQKR